MYTNGRTRHVSSACKKERERENKADSIKRDDGEEVNGGDAEEGTGHATTGRLVARGGDKRANTISPRLLHT